ncbi:MAG: hypothetical protein K5978_04405 [Campylobacter sp.]|nr:hypothetical protein [Campylobacter sp.]
MRLKIAFLALCVTLFATTYDTAKAYADHYAKKLPLRIDDYFTLTALLNVGDELLYHYKVNDTSKFVIKSMKNSELERYKNELKKANLTRHCADPDVRTMLKSGVLLHHMFYRDYGAKLLFDFIIKEQDCKM